MLQAFFLVLGKLCGENLTQYFRGKFYVLGPIFWYNLNLTYISIFDLQTADIYKYIYEYI